jgi:hypothetical protein
MSASSSTRIVALNLEALEQRAVPSATAPAGQIHPPPANVFLATAYQVELGRPVDDIGLNFWRDQMAHGATREQVIAGILHSDEFFAHEITVDYTELLGRAPDSDGMQFYLQALKNGATPQDVRASILGSDEFFRHAGGQSHAFLNALYQLELGRPIDSQGEAFWTSKTGTAAGRTSVARAAVTSVEGSQREVRIVYADLLGRTPDADGMAFWSGKLEQDQSEAVVLAGVIGSNEFFSRMQSFSDRVNTTDPNVAAAAFVGHAGVVAPDANAH